MVVIGQNWLYSGKIGCIRTKMVVFGQGGCFRASVFVFGQSSCIPAKWCYFS